MNRKSIAVLVGAFLLSGQALAVESDILVLGGTGQLGSEVVKDLVEAGESVTVLVRPTSNRERLAGLEVNYVVGDMLSDADMERVFTENRYDVVVDTSGSPVFGGDQNFYEASQKVISKWAKVGQVGHMILHGATGAGDSAAMMIFDKVPEPQRIAIGSKSKAEDILKQSGVTYTIIRHLSLMDLDTQESGKARLTTNQMAIGPVTRDGLARLTLECIENPACYNMTFHAVDDEVDLSGRFEGIWQRYRSLIKPYVFEARQAAGLIN